MIRDNIEKCFACGACVSACEKKAITFCQNNAGFLIPLLNESKCVHCGRCSEVCPIDKKIETRESHSFKLAGDVTIRKNSSSGGAFQLLARKTIEHGGVVFGAALDSLCDLKIIDIDGLEDMDKLVGSKYIQAHPDDAFLKVREYLNLRREVLFCSTPCMIHGLKLFIGDDNPLLRTVDLVCRGVPSGGLWKRYIEYLDVMNKRRTTDFRFRDKVYSAYGRTVSYFSENEKHFEHHSENKWMRLYQRLISINESCMKCSYGLNCSDADVTLGDFWKNSEDKAEGDDPLGTSLVVTHTSLGFEMLKEITGDCFCEDVSNTDYLHVIHSYPQKISILRKLFFNEFDKCPVTNCDIEFLLKKYSS